MHCQEKKDVDAVITKLETMQNYFQYICIQSGRYCLQIPLSDQYLFQTVNDLLEGHVYMRGPLSYNEFYHTMDPSHTMSLGSYSYFMRCLNLHE